MELSPKSRGLIDFDASHLSQMQSDVTTWFEKSLFDLENKYKIVINDLIEQKMLIQQKLMQRYISQINHLNKLRVNMIENRLNRELKMNDDINVETENMNMNNSIEQTKKAVDTTQILIENDKQSCINTNNKEGIDYVDVPISIKDEPLEPELTDIDNDNNNSNNGKKFDINKTDERMRIQINNHIANIEKRISGEKYQCNDCNKQFKTFSNAQSHIAHTHIDEKPFKCDQCDKSFAMWRFLSRHKNIHSSKYQCKICGKKWLSLNCLQIHERIHTGEKPYQCDICLKKFVQRGGLISHKAYNHSDKKLWYKCHQCDASFPLKGYLHTHQRRCKKS